MTGFKARSLASAFATAAISAAAFIAPGTASAKTCGTGPAITGNGSSLQANAQQKYWGEPWNTACPSEKVTYTKTSSGEGLESWWVNENPAKFKGFGALNAFVGTDQPPSTSQSNEILKKGPGAKVLSIPVLQAAVALPIHLPENCTATSGKGSKLIHRLVLSDATLQKIFAHEITTWGQINGSYNEDKIGGTSCVLTTPITRVLREEGSGTTSIIKKFLYEINKEPLSNGETWNESAEGVENTKWPAETTNVVREKKGSGIVGGVEATAGSIGYANLNEVREKAAFQAPNGNIFWPELQSKTKKFEDPSTDGEVAAAARANCAGEAYVSLNGSGKQAKFPPQSVEVPWNEVTASITQKKSYPLCGFTYDLSTTKFSDFVGSEPSNEPTAAEVETVHNYLEFILTEGQTIINENHDFLALPTGKKEGNVLEIAKKGLPKIVY